MMWSSKVSQNSQILILRYSQTKNLFPIEYRSVTSSNFLFLHFIIFMTIFQQNMMKNPHKPNLTWIGSWWPEIWPHEYLISPIEISVNWPGSKQLWTRPIFTDFNGLIRYSCSHISGSHEPIPTKFGLWMFFIMLHRYIISKTLKCESFLWRHHFCTLLFLQPFSCLYLWNQLTNFNEFCCKR